MAGARLVRERSGHTLQATALVNEAFLRLAPGEQNWQNRAHFFGSAARAMRRILVDHARRHQASKRGGSEAQKVTFSDLVLVGEEPNFDLVALDEALDALAKDEPRLAEVVQLRFFAGLGIPETASLLGISPATVKRDWTYARAWLLERMS